MVRIELGVTQLSVTSEPERERPANSWFLAIQSWPVAYAPVRWTR